MESLPNDLVWEHLPCEPLVWETALPEFRCLTLDSGSDPVGQDGDEDRVGTSAPEMEEAAVAVGPSPEERENFAYGIARWTQLEMESMFLREVARSLAFPLRVNTIVKLPHGRLPRVLERLVPRLESFVQHGYQLREDTLAGLLKVFLITGDNEHAVSFAELAAPQSGGGEFTYYRALALFRLGRYDTARVLAERSVQIDPASGSGHLLLVACQIKEGDGHGAGRTLAGAVPLFLADEAVLRFSIPWIRRAGNEDALVRVLSRLAEIQPDDRETRLTLADIFCQRGQVEDACRLYEAYRDRLDRHRVCRYGVCLARLGQEDEAFSVLSGLLVSPQKNHDLEYVVHTLYDSGFRDSGLVLLIAQRMVDRGRVEECLEFCSRQGEAVVQNAGLVFVQVQCYTQLGRFDQALALLEAMPTGSAACEDERAYLKGYLLFVLGRKDDAVSGLEVGTRLPGREVAALRMLGEIADQSGDHHKAAGLYRKLSRLLKDDAGVIARAAWSSMRAGMVSLAIEGFRDLVRVLPECPEGWNNLGVLLARSGQYEEAARAFKTSLRLAPDQPEAGKNLALVYDRVLRSKSAEYLERFADGELSASGEG